MSQPRTVLEKLIALSKVDASLAQMAAEQKKLTTQLADKLLELKSTQEDSSGRAAELADRKERYRREEKRLEEEQQKLVDRRKGLASFSDYKTQQAAGKEIEHSSKQLGAQEEALLGTLDALDDYEKETTDKAAVLEALEKEVADLEEDVKGTIANLEERMAERSGERKTLVEGINARDLTIYERIQNKHPVNPVVSVGSDYHCQGCFMQVGAQSLVKLSRGDELVKCRGCARILFLDQSASEEKTE
jgi:predicted  nucleic acid-binding Zn-ribbon protein